jgi:hypothetical protein
LFNTLGFFIFVKKLIMDWSKLEKKFKRQFTPDESQVMIFAWIKDKVQNPESYTYQVTIPANRINVFVCHTITSTSMEFIQ